jgi:hypothetical protein
MEIPNEFSLARKLYPGTKRGDEVEFLYFQSKYKTSWREILPKILPAIQEQMAAREALNKAKEFVPNWQHFKVWINNCGWTLEIAPPKKTMYAPKRAEAQAKPAAKIPEMIKSNLWVLCLKKNKIIKQGKLHRISFQNELPSENERMKIAIKTAEAYSMGGGEFTVIEADSQAEADMIADKMIDSDDARPVERMSEKEILKGIPF